MPATETILCLAIAASRVHARDLAAAVPALAALPPDRVLAWTPSPGAKRWLHPAEWRRWLPPGAAASGPDRPICLERAVAAPLPAAISRALEAALSPGLRFELIDWARAPLPEGRYVFDERVLPQPPPGPGGRSRPVLWRGALEDAERRRHAFWVRVRVTRLVQAVRARERLAAGAPISSVQLEEGVYETPAGAASAYSSVEEALGCKPRRAIAAGETVDPSACPPRRGVEPGEDVTVLSRAGAAALTVHAKAQTGGPPGAWIWLENPATRRRFRARVTGRGSAEPASATSATAPPAIALPAIALPATALPATAPPATAPPATAPPAGVTPAGVTPQSPEGNEP